MASSCTDMPLYHHFEHTSAAGWEKSDPVSFGLPAAQTATDCNLNLELRYNKQYPFTSLTLIVDQTIFPSQKHQTDTLWCQLFDASGRETGTGVSLFQASFPVRRLHLAQGDSLSVSVRHHMKREILPGITDVGLVVERQR